MARVRRTMVVAFVALAALGIGLAPPAAADQCAPPGEQSASALPTNLAAMTMVVVTHEMGFAQSAADAVVFMDHGAVVESGPPERVFGGAETDRLRQFLSQVL